MQIEVYNMIANDDLLEITLEAICDSFSSLIWDIEYYSCGEFEVYIAASPTNVEIFQTGRIVGRSDDSEHYGLIESVQIETDAENGDYLTVKGRFLMCLLERRIIFPTFNFTSQTMYSQIIKNVVSYNACTSATRKIPGLSLGDVTGDCWKQKTKLQISYDNLMEWVYTICEKIGGTANIRLVKTDDEKYEMVMELSQGADRSILQEENPHIVFSDTYNNLLSFGYATDTSVEKNFAYVFGEGEGSTRTYTTYCDGNEPTNLARHEIYVDAKDVSSSSEEEISNAEYLELLKEQGKENMVAPTIASEFEVAVQSMQFQYNQDYFVGDYVTVEHHRFGLKQNKIQLVGMIESFDSNGRKLTPTFKI